MKIFLKGLNATLQWIKIELSTDAFNGITIPVTCIDVLKNYFKINNIHFNKNC